MSRTSLKRIKVKTPGGRIVIHYKKRNPSIAKSSLSKEPLQGMKRLTPSKLKKLPKTKKRPERPFGGTLSSKDARKKILEFNPIVGQPLDIGQVVIKTAGREAGKIAVIIDKLKGNFVLIDGHVRRKKCNILHLEAIDKKIKIKPGASTDAIIKEFKQIGIEIKKTKPKKGQKTKIKGQTEIKSKKTKVRDKKSKK